MKTYNLPIQNLDVLHSLYKSTLCPDELNSEYSVSATWFKLSELDQLPKETNEFFVALHSILLQPNICIIATKSSDFVFSYWVHQQFFTIQELGLFNLYGEEVFIDQKEIYVTPVAIPDFIVQDILNDS